METEAARFIRRFAEAANRGDLDSVRAGYHPDVELVAYPSGSPDAGTFSGRKEVLRWFGDWFGVLFDEWRTDIEELWEPAAGIVVTRNRVFGRGRASGITVEGDTLHNGFELRDGLIVRISVAATPDEALAGVGRADLAGTLDGPPPNQGASQ